MIENSKILVVAGKFSETGGEADPRIDMICKNLEGAMIINGGMTDFLKEFIENGANDYSIIYWIPTENIPEIEALITKEKKGVFKTISNSTLTDEEIGKEVENRNCHALIKLSEGEEAPLISVIDISGTKVLEASSFEEITESIKDEKILRKILRATPAKEKYVEPTITMERLHLRVMGGTIDVLYRPVHSYIEFVNDDETGRARVKELALMSREEFSKYLDGLHSPLSVKKEKVNNLSTSHDEDWYQKAWIVQTKKLFEEIGVENPVEEPIWR